MPELPASIRVALWASSAWSSGADGESVLSCALPDVDVVVGLGEQLALWRELGERALYAALPRPGVPGILPRCGPAALAAASDAGEAVFVATVGGLAVPRLVSFGTESAGLAARWEGFDAEPMPVHRLAGVDLAGADRELRTQVHAAIETLGDGGWRDAWQRDRPDQVEREWSLPAGLPERIRDVLLRSGSVLQIAQAALVHADGSVTMGLAEHRRAALLPVRDSASAALSAAACAGAAYFAAQPRSTRS